MNLFPWEYLFLGFSGSNFPDLFGPIWIASLVFLVATIVLYLVRTRQLRHHPPYLAMYEWLLWTAVLTFGLVLVYAVFRIDFIFVVVTLVAGLGVLVWARFVKFPPEFEAYHAELARSRYFSRSKFSRPEATIRPRRRRRRR